MGEAILNRRESLNDDPMSLMAINKAPISHAMPRPAGQVTFEKTWGAFLGGAEGMLLGELAGDFKASEGEN